MADVTPRSSLPKVIEWRALLTDFPPGTRAPVSGGVAEGTGSRPKAATPELQLYCDEGCKRVTYCGGVIRREGHLFPGSEPQNVWDGILWYECSECKSAVKSYGVRLIGSIEQLTQRYIEAVKIAEWPQFSFRTPPKVNALMGPDRDLFFKGRKAECEGLGVGAFAYYRRIVEDQKNRLLGEIINVARRTNAPPDAIAQLETAMKEIQFHKAVDMVKNSVPPPLLIKGHNPLTLLHSALSKGIHAASDEVCLEVAHDIRIILFELAERLSQAVKDEQELTDAVSRLLNPGS